MPTHTKQLHPFVYLRILTFLAFALAITYYAHGRFTWRVVGKSPSQIHSTLGPPSLITSNPAAPSTSFTYHYFRFQNTRYILHFKNNQVTSTETSTRPVLPHH